MMADDKNQAPEGEEATVAAVAPETAAPEAAAEAAAPEAVPEVAAEAATPEAEAPQAAAETEAPAEAEAPGPAEAAPAPAAAAPEPVEASSPVAAGSAPPEGRRERGARGGRGGGGGRDNRGGGNRGRRDERGRGRGGDDEGGEELIEKLVHINRVSKTVKGGKRFGFAALVVVGDGKGRAGFGHGKAREVPEAISKATAAAKKAMVRVPLRDGRTLHHDGLGHFGAGRVYLRSAPAGTGIIAGGPMRAVFESLGVHDVVTKSIGTSNPYNMIRATFEALGEQTSPKSVAQRRGKKIADLMARRDGVTSAAEASADAEALVE
jgi:small subunit ribosomal protein S5